MIQPLLRRNEKCEVSHCHFTTSQPMPPHEVPIYRLVVKARSTGHKGYVWEILRDREDQTRNPDQRSKWSYKTMEETYTQSTVALNRCVTSSLPPSPSHLENDWAVGR